VEEIIDTRYQTKDWLKDRGIADFLTPDRKELKVFIHGLVALSNENQITYKNCKLEDLSYHKHKYPTLITLSELTEKYFNGLNLPANCKELSQDEMWALFKVMYNPDLTITQILNEIKKEEDTLFQEKHVFLEKLRLLEQENLTLTQTNSDLEGMRNNLMTLNHELTYDVEKVIQSKELLQGELDELKLENKKLAEAADELEILKERSDELDEIKENSSEISKQLSDLEQENRKLKLRQEKKGIAILAKRMEQFRLASVILILLLGFSVAYFTLINPGAGSGGGMKRSTLERIYPQIEELYKSQAYEKIVKIWKDTKFSSSELKSADYQRFGLIFFYVGAAYQDMKENQKAIENYNLFLLQSKEKKAELVQNEMIAYNNIGALYSHLRRFNLAESNYRKAIMLSKRTNQLKLEAEFCRNLATLFYIKKEYSEALSYFKRSYDIAKFFQFRDVEKYRRNYEDVKQLLKAQESGE